MQQISSLTKTVDFIQRATCTRGVQ